MSVLQYFNGNNCDVCSALDCKTCLDSVGYSLYFDFRNIAPKADKILVIARNSNWQGKTGFKVIDFNEDLVNTLLAINNDATKVIKKEGKSFYIMAYSHDTPCGSRWDLKPVVSRGRDDAAIINSYMLKMM